VNEKMKQQIENVASQVGSEQSRQTGMSVPPAEKLRNVSLLRRIGAFPIRVYQCSLGYLLGGHCRFTPSCSFYGLEAVEKHGVFKGWWMAVCRICRCHPFCPGGHDPVPPAPDEVERR
jgi:uncharacterized protein